jgi:hypothetical protein
LYKIELRRNAWRLFGVLITFALVITTFSLWKFRPERETTRTVFQPATRTDTETTSPAPEEIIPPPPTVQQARPTCASGKWITLLASIRDGDTIQDLTNKAGTVAKREPYPVDLKYSGTTKTCDTLRDGFIILYAGPFNSAEEAAALCRQLGWRTDAKEIRNECLGKSLDPTLDLQTVWPSGKLVK